MNKEALKELEVYCKDISIKFGGELIPNIIISRTLGEMTDRLNGESPLGWVVSVGKMGCPLAHFYNQSLADCFAEIESAIKSGDCRSDWERVMNEASDLLEG